MGTTYQDNQKKGLRPYVHRSKRRGSAEHAGVDIRDVPKVEPGNYSLLLLLNQALSYRLSPINENGEPINEWVQTEPRSTLRLVAGTIQPTGTDEPRQILPTGKFARAAFLWLMLATAKHQSPKISVSSFLDFLYKFYASGAANFTPEQTDTRFLKRVKASAFELAKLDKLMMLSAEILEGRGEHGPVHGLIFHPVPCDAFHKSIIDNR